MTSDRQMRLRILRAMIGESRYRVDPQAVARAIVARIAARQRLRAADRRGLEGRLPRE